MMGESDYARWHIKAYEADPQSPRGLLYGCIGYLNSKNIDRHKEVLRVLIETHPDSEEAWSAKIKVCGDSSYLKALFREIPPHLLDCDEVNYSLVGAGVRTELFDEAIEWSGRLKKSDEQSILTKHILIQAIVEKARRDPFPDMGQVAQIQFGINVSTEIVESEVFKHSKWIVTSTHILRSFLFEFIGNDEAAMLEINRAIHVAPDDCHTHIRKAMFRAIREGVPTAIAALKASIPKWEDDTEVAFVIARLEYLGRTDGWSDRVLSILNPRKAQIITIGVSYETPVFVLFVSCAMAGRPTDCVGINDELQSQYSKTDDPDDINWLKFYAAISADLQGDRSHTDPFGECRFLSPINPLLLRSIAEYCKATGRLIAAFNSLVDLALQVRPEYVEREISDLALKIDDPLVVTGKLRQLRSVKGELPGLVNAESAVLFQAGQQLSAIELMRAFLDRNISRLQAYRAMVVNFCQFAILADEKQKIKSEYIAILTESPGTDPNDLVLVVRILSEVGRPEDAVSIAYQALRKFRDSPEIQIAYATCFLPKCKIQIQPCNTISEDSAFGYFRVGDSRVLSVIVERDDPSRSHGEISPDSSLYKAASGKSAGERFALGDLEYEVKYVAEKRLHRAKEIVDTWEEKNPEIFFVKRINLPSLPDGSIDVSAITKFTDKDHEKTENLVSVYRETKVPLHFIAKSMGRPFLAAIELITSCERWIISSGSEPEWIGGLKSVTAKDAEIILERSAFWSLIFTDQHRIIALTKRKVLVDESTLTEARSVIKELKENSDGSFLSPYGKGKFTIRDRNAEHMIEYAARIQRAIDFHVSSGLVVDPIATDSVPSEDLRKLFDLFGAPLQLICEHARRSNLLVLVEDKMTRDLLGSLGVRCSWCQPFLYSCHERGDLPLAEYSGYVAALCAHRFHHVMIHLNIAADIYARSSWDARSPTTAGVLASISDGGVDSRGQAMIMAWLIKDAWKNKATVESAVADSVAMLQMVKGNTWVYLFLMAMARKVDDIIPIDIDRQNAFRVFAQSQMYPKLTKSGKRRLLL